MKGHLIIPLSQLGMRSLPGFEITLNECYDARDESIESLIKRVATGSGEESYLVVDLEADGQVYKYKKTCEETVELDG